MKTFMKTINLFAATLAVAMTAMTMTSCDGEDIFDNDVVGKSEYAGVLFINEVEVNGNPDWIELYNSSDEAINIDRFSIYDDGGVEAPVVLGSNVVPANGYLALERNATGSFTFGLSSSGESLVLLDGDGALIDNVAIPAVAGGVTYGRTVDGGSSWSTQVPSKELENGSVAEVVLLDSEYKDKLFINEVEVNGDPDWIELYNSSNEPINIGRFSIYDGGGPEATDDLGANTVPANGYLVLERKADGSFTFGLSSSGESLVLLDSDGALIDNVTIPAVASGSTYGRTTDGGTKWDTLATPTQGASNTTND